MSTLKENDKKIILSIFNRKIAFHRHLNLNFNIDTKTKATAESEVPTEAMGYRFVHGGFIATMLDAVGSLQVVTNIMLNDQIPDSEKLERVSKVSTIDIRIDFVNPAAGGKLIASSEAVKIGHHVAFIRAEVRSEAGQIIAVSSATYRTG